MELPQLIVITDWQLGAQTLLKRLEDALSVSPRIAVQHRHPQASGRQFFAEAEQVASLCARRGNPLLVNGRADVALALGAHLHLPASGLRASDVRDRLPSHLWISCAVHDLAESEHARGATFALVSPVFPPTSKRDDDRPTLGAEGFRTLAERLSCPAFALGGIRADNAHLLPTGTRMAVIGGVLHAKDSAQAASSLLSHAGRS